MKRSFPWTILVLRSQKKMTENDYKKIVRAIEGKFFEEGDFSDKSDIEEISGLSRHKVDELVDEMSGSGLVPVYEKNATIYATQRMFDALSGSAVEPDWIEDYEFDAKNNLRDKIDEMTDEIGEYRRLERLLYGMGSSLEESVEEALDFLGFDFGSTVNAEDFLIEDDEHKFVIEVKSANKPISKDAVDQLGGWIQKAIENGVEMDNISGILLFNHQATVAPSERDRPLTESAEDFLDYHHSVAMSTEFLFDIVKAVKTDEMPKEIAREEIIEKVEL